MSAREGGGGSGLRVLVLDPLFRPPDQPGPARTHGIARRLIQAGHRVTVLTTNAALPESTPSEVAGIQLDVISEARARFGFPPPTVAFSRAIPGRIWRHEDVDVVIATDCPPLALLAAMIFCGARAAQLLLDVRRLPPAETPAQAFDAAMATTGRRIARSAARFAHRVFAVSPEIRDRMIADGVPAARVTVSPLAAEITAPSSNTESPLPVTGRILLYAGPFAPEGVERLVLVAKAADTLSAADAFRIVVCGDGPARGRLETLARDTGVLERTLWIAPPLSPHTQAAAFAAASAVVAPSFHDDMEASAAFFDGLAAGKPMVVWGSGPNRELVESRAAGIGLPADPAVAARELADFLRDTDGLRRAGSQALALAGGRFGLERTTAEIRAAVEEAAAAAPRLAILRERMLRNKRIADVVVSLAGIVVLSPVMVAIGIAIGLKMGWPPLFTQERPGLKGETFRIYKFRTMSNATDAAGAPLPDEARLTPLGKFLRRTSLDELPELFNVLMGDMSLVGPRPLLPEYIPHYTAEQRRRHELRPGITGWSQINGRNATTWEDRFKLDVWYVDNLSLWLDFKIILKTFWIAITGEGVNAPGHATMPRFDEVVARREGAEDI